MTNSLPANDLRHGFQLGIQNLICEMIKGSKGIDISFSQLQCHCWGGGLLGTAPLLSPFLVLRSCAQFKLMDMSLVAPASKEH